MLSAVRDADALTESHQMSVARGNLHLPVPQQLAVHRKSLTKRQGTRSETRRRSSAHVPERLTSEKLDECALEIREYRIQSACDSLTAKAMAGSFLKKTK